MKQLLISPLSWDTDFFKVNCGRMIVDSESLDMTDFERVSKDYDFVSIQNIGNSIDINKKIAEYTDAFLVDINIQFEKKVDICAQEFETEYRSTIIKATDISDCVFDKLKVEQTDFSYSKFICDEELRRRNGYLVYKEWLKNARNDERKYFILFKEKELVGAFILFSIQNDIATIELVKVNRQFQGRHIATFLIGEIEQFTQHIQVKKLRVGTQLNNIPAMNLYHKLGFKEVSRTSIFHYWKKR